MKAREDSGRFKALRPASGTFYAVGVLFFRLRQKRGNNIAVILHCLPKVWIIAPVDYCSHSTKLTHG